MVTEHKDGGYSMDGNGIGLVLTVVAVVQIPFQVSQRVNLSSRCRCFLPCVEFYQ